MTTLLNIARRADNLFDVENFIARERVGDHGRGGHHGHGGHHAGGSRGSGTPEAAGGPL